MKSSAATIAAPVVANRPAGPLCVHRYRWPDVPGEVWQAWDRLQQGNGKLDSPFLRPEYAQICGECLEGTEIAVVEGDEEIQAVFPYQRVGKQAGLPLGGLLADVHGLICPPDWTCDVAWLLRECKLAGWTFDHLLAEQECFRPYHRCLDSAPYMELSGGFDEYCHRLEQNGSGALKQFEHRSRKLQREVGPLTFEWDARDAAVIQTALAWKRQQVRQQYYDDMFDRSDVLHIVHRCCQSRAESFEGVVSALRAGDHLVAVNLGLRCRGILSAWIPTYNPEFSRYSPGLVLHVELARAAADHAVTRVDLGRGENQTKRRLMTGTSPVALGAVELRPLRQWLRGAWFQMRKVVYATPLRGAPLAFYRRVRRFVRQHVVG